LKVLIVDDNITNIEALKNLFKLSKIKDVIFEVYNCNDGKIAIA